MFLFVWIEDNVHGLTVITLPMAMDTAADESKFYFQANGVKMDVVEACDFTLKTLSVRLTLEDLFNELRPVALRQSW